MCVLSWFVLDSRPKYDLDKIPGPWRHAKPVVGNILECLRADFHRKLLEWTNQYGGIYRCAYTASRHPLVDRVLHAATAQGNTGLHLYFKSQLCLVGPPYASLTASNMLVPCLTKCSLFDHTLQAKIPLAGCADRDRPHCAGGHHGAW